MKMSWKENGNLFFDVYKKPNQQLKYLDTLSIHPSHCTDAIPKGVYQRLTKLTSITDENQDQTLDAIYPEHFQALRQAGLIHGEVPTLLEMHEKIKVKNSMINTKDKAKKLLARKRQVYFCIGYSSIWKTKIHRTLDKIRKKYKTLNFLRISMSYHRFPNLREIFQGDLQGKLNQGITSKDFINEECNCMTRGGQRNCQYDGICRNKIIVYEVKCKATGKIYIGNTQQNFKQRMRGHFNDVQSKIKKNKASDSYAEHFAIVHKTNDPTGIPSPATQRDNINSRVIWQGNPMSAVKSFGTNNCLLCNREKLAILKQSLKDKYCMINSCSEVYGACRHIPRFHRFPERHDPSTDDCTEHEKSRHKHTTSSDMSSSNSDKRDSSDISSEEEYEPNSASLSSDEEELGGDSIMQIYSPSRTVVHNTILV